MPLVSIINVHNNLIYDNNILHLNPAKDEFVRIIDFYKRRINSYLYPENFSIREATNNLFKMINEINIYISNQKSLSNTWFFLSSLTKLIYPIMPNFALELSRHLFKESKITAELDKNYFNAKLVIIPHDSILEVMSVKQKIA